MAAQIGVPESRDLLPDRILSLADYRRRVAESFAAVRRAAPNRATWRAWRRERDRLFATHPQSALDADVRTGFGGLAYFEHDPTMRVNAVLQLVHVVRPVLMGHNDADRTRFIPFATAHITVQRRNAQLLVYWLDAYGGGLFVPFRDATSGSETYGGGRYLLDTVKGADLGPKDGRVVFDFNYAYHPSCVYSDRWSCPLAPPENTLAFAVDAGERLIGRRQR